jgi:hypothetical protein
MKKKTTKTGNLCRKCGTPVGQRFPDTSEARTGVPVVMHSCVARYGVRLGDLVTR